MNKGFTFREGSSADLPAYYPMLQASEPRQTLDFCSEESFLEMWRILQPHDYVKLFLVECKGEIVAAQLAITFGDIVLNKSSVWSGVHGDYCPNELLQCSVIEWAKAHHFCYYDLGYIALDAAQLASRRQPLPNSFKQTPALEFDFGSEVVRLPDVYTYIYNPLLKWTYTTVFSKITDSSAVQAMLHRLWLH